MKIEDIFSKDQVIFLESSEKQHAIKEIVQHLENLGIIKNCARYYTQIAYRESLENTGIGKGFAIPHARTDSLDKLIMIFGVSKAGIEYESYDKIPVNYILLSLFPTSLSATYLYLVGMLAKCTANQKVVTSLAEAKKPDQLYKILSGFAKDYLENIDEKRDSKIDMDSRLTGIPITDLDLLIRLNYLYGIFDADKSPEIKEKINKLSHLIDKRSLSYFERMRSKCKNPFSYIEKNACSGCHMTIAPIEMNDIKEKKKVSICSSCGRFLISL